MSEAIMCGGCGATDPQKRCIGCLHDFGTADSAWVRKYHAPIPDAPPPTAVSLAQALEVPEIARLLAESKAVVRNTFPPNDYSRALEAAIDAIKGSEA